MPKYIIDDIEISSDSDEENFDEKNFDEENSAEENSDEENFKKIFFLYIMVNNKSSKIIVNKHHQEHKQRLWKEAYKRYQSLSEEDKRQKANKGLRKISTFY